MIDINVRRATHFHSYKSTKDWKTGALGSHQKKQDSGSLVRPPADTQAVGVD